ncbi:MAG: MlaD family protein [Phycisphaerae bacterium]|nr:MlaD family protein [Phycisphaerae bacterium]
MSDYEKIQKRRNFIVGVFVFAALMALFWMIFKFGDLPVVISQWKSYRVKIQFPDAPGVQENTPVRFCGYQIGRVTQVKPPQLRDEVGSGKKYHQVLVVVSIDKEFSDIPGNVRVKLLTRGLGSSFISLDVPLPDGNEPRGVLTDGMLLQGTTGVASEFFPEETQQKIDELTAGIAKLVENTNQIVGDEENKKNIGLILANISKASEQTTETLKTMEKFLASGKGASDEMGKTFAELRLAIEKLNSGSGTMAKMFNDGRLYEGMLDLSQQLELLVSQMRSFVEQSKEKGLPLKLK